MIWVILLAIFGLTMIVAEVFFPSMGVLSILAAVCLTGAVLLGFQEGQVTGFLVLSVAVIGAPVAWIFALRALPNTPFGKRLVLDAQSLEGSNRAGQETGLEDLLNKTGESISPLRPAGYARIDGRRVDVVTRGELLDSGERVRVIEVEGNRVVVAKQDPPN